MASFNYVTFNLRGALAQRVVKHRQQHKRIMSSIKKRPADKDEQNDLPFDRYNTIQRTEEGGP